MGIRVSSNKKSKEAKSTEKLASAICTYLFENGSILYEYEKNTLGECRSILFNILARLDG